MEEGSRDGWIHSLDAEQDVAAFQRGTVEGTSWFCSLVCARCW